jgi:hypothetical protein
MVKTRSAGEEMQHFVIDDRFDLARLAHASTHPMWHLNQILNRLFDLLMQPFAGESPWPGLVAVSLLTAVVLVLLFRATSNPDAILRARNRLLARTLELLLFQHDMRVSLTACGRILAANTAYLGRLVPPIAVGLVPLVLIFVQLEAWFDRRPLHVGDATVLTVELDPAFPVVGTPVELQLPAIVRMDSPPVRSPAKNEVAWRLVATRPGDGSAEIRLDDAPPESKTLVVGPNMSRVSPRRPSAGFVLELLAPSERPLSKSSPIRRIEAYYPRRETTLGLTQVHWLFAAFLLMMLFSLILAPLFGVRIA